MKKCQVYAVVEQHGSGSPYIKLRAFTDLTEAQDELKFWQACLAQAIKNSCNSSLQEVSFSLVSVDVDANQFHRPLAGYHSNIWISCNSNGTMKGYGSLRSAKREKRFFEGLPEGKRMQCKIHELSLKWS